MGLENLSFCLKIVVVQLSREVKLPLRIVLCEECPYDLINVLGPFHSFCNDEIIIKLNLPILLAQIRQREKSQKYFDLLAFI